MAAKGMVYPWQKLKCLEEYIESRREDFTKTFFGEEYYVDRIGFMGDGLMVQISNDVRVDETRVITGKQFKRWLQGY